MGEAYAPLTGDFLSRIAGCARVSRVLPVNEPGDEALLQRTAAGDDAAFEALVRRFEQPLYRFLRRVTGCPQTADDVRTWTYLRVYEKASQYRGGSARAWVFRIAWR